MKRVLTLLLTLILAISLVSCGNKEDPDKNKGNEIPDIKQEGINTPIIDIT